MKMHVAWRGEKVVDMYTPDCYAYAPFRFCIGRPSKKINYFPKKIIQAIDKAKTLLILIVVTNNNCK